MAESKLFSPPQRVSKPNPLGKKMDYSIPWTGESYEGAFCNTQATPMYENTDQENSVKTPNGGK